MAALASIDDYQDLTGQVVAAEDEVRITRLLGFASEAVLAGAHGQTIEQSTTTDLICRPYEGVVYLPQRPVTAVTSVSVGGVTVDPSGYRFTSGGNRRHAKLIRRVTGGDSCWADCLEVTVTYVHGWATIPGPIISAVVNMASSVVANAGGPAVAQEGTGPFSTTFATFDLQSSTMSLSGPTKSVLAALCGVDQMASVPVGKQADAR